jgi:hypothetical protein
VADTRSCSGIGLASPIGFEPTAPGLGILCSILLSYGDIQGNQRVSLSAVFSRLTIDSSRAAFRHLQLLFSMPVHRVSHRPCRRPRKR